MDRKELIYKFSEETGEKVHAQLPDMGSYNDEYVYWLEQQVKNCSIPDVSYCAEQTKNVLTNKFCNIAKEHVGETFDKVPEATNILTAIDVIEKHCS